MLQASVALLGALFTVGVCYAAGSLTLQGLNLRLRPAEHFPLGMILGASVAHLGVFALLILNLGYKQVVIGVGTLTILAAVWRRPWLATLSAKDGSPRLPLALKLALGAVFLLFTNLYIFEAWKPEDSADGASYHLGLVARYLREHGMHKIVTNFYALISSGVDLLFVPAFAIGRHSAAALVHFAFAMVLALAIFAYGRRIGKPWVGAAAALFVYLAPVVGIAGTSAYNDVAVAAIVFAVFYWLEIWDAERTTGALVALGLIAGYALAAKYTAFVMLPYALGFVAWKQRRWKPVLIVAVCAAVMIAPWVARNWIWYENPVAPFANKVFRNPYVHAMFEQDYTEYLHRYGIQNLWTLPWQVTMRGDKTQGLLGPLFLAAPLALASLRSREGRRLLLPGLLLLAVYPANVGTRFLIPCLPFFSLGMALAISWPPALMALVAFHAITSWPSMIARWAPPYAWHLSGRIPYKAALREIPQDRYLHDRDYQYRAVRMIQHYVPEGERVLALSGLPDSYTSHEILVSFQSAFNEVATDILNMGWEDLITPTAALEFRFPTQTARRIRVVETAAAEKKEQWSVHELRFFANGTEIERKQEWRLRAWPNPWDVQMAFDNSPATRWRTWETALPGDYLDVDFGRDQQVDEVRIETSRDQSTVRLRAEMMDPQGRWITLSDKPVELDSHWPGSIRRAVTHELRLRKVNYLIVEDNDWGAMEFAKDPESWDFRIVARQDSATLYRVMQP